jgi:N-acetyl-gamma-glutamyl-phosphate reductase
MKAGILGATGYAGAELVRILCRHPEIDSLSLSSVSFEGEKIEDVYPNFRGVISAPLVKAEEVIAAVDVVFAALPHGVGEPYALACIEKGIPFIDLSADFRFDEDEATFSAWYGKPYQFPELRKKSVYGLPELNRERIRKSTAAGPVIIGNPGCYPTGASLGAFPALAKGLAEISATIIVDSASGVSGGGREPSRSFHYPECADSVAPYKVGCHRHTPEVARNFEAMAATGVTPYRPAVIFTPHLVPVNRGILSTIYIPLARETPHRGSTEPRFPSATPHRGSTEPRFPSAWRGDSAAEEIRILYSNFYKDEPFVRVLPANVTAATGRVRHSNYCDISVHLDHGGTTLIVITAIDNMVKGAAGQAVQNMNVVFGFNERAGLEMIPSSF